MESSEIGLEDNALNESEANPAPAGQPTNAQSPEDVTPPQPVVRCKGGSPDFCVRTQ